MRIRYEGTGATTVEGCGTVEHGNEIEVPDGLGEALVKENPADWKRVRPKEAKKAGGGD